MNVAVRLADPGDADAMVALVEAHRERLEAWPPEFRRRAPGSAAMRRAWFGHLPASRDKAACLVAEEKGRRSASGREAGWRTLTCVPPRADEARNAALSRTALPPTSRWWSVALRER